MDMNNAKTLAVFAVIFGCFAVLYPKIFHPIIVHVVWGAPPVQQAEYGPRTGQSPPASVAGGAQRASEAHDMHKFMRGGPHPGMRAAAEIRKQMAPQQGGGGKGMMGFVLPMYAIGIVLYLLYTLSKVFGNKKDDEKQEEGSSRYDSDDTASRRERKEKMVHKELEDLLLKCDEKKISPEELYALRRRLEETETQMSRILAAMEAVSEKRPPGPVDSSPDMDTYEIINGEKEGVAPKVETVGVTTTTHSDGEDGDDEADDEEHDRDEEEEDADEEQLDLQEDHFKLQKDTAKKEVAKKGTKSDTNPDAGEAKQRLDETKTKSTNEDEAESSEAHGIEEVVDKVIKSKEESEKEEEKPVRRRVKAASEVQNDKD